MNYESRIVLFLDILGFKKHVLDTLDKDKDSGEHVDNEQRTASMYDVLSGMGEIAGVNGDGRTINVTQFSDSIVISFLDKSPSKASTVFEIILRIIIHLVKNGIVCRGALSYGKLIHDSRIIFGPALIDAYETESQAAMYPRVIMDRNIYDYSRMYLDKKTDQLVVPEGISEYLKQDLDGKYYIDFLNAAHRVIPFDEDLVKYYKMIREIIINGRKYEQPDLKVKYGWLKMKYNRFLSNVTAEKVGSKPFLYLSKLKKLK